MTQDDIEAYRVGSHEVSSFQFDPAVPGIAIGSYENAQLYKESSISAIYIAPSSTHHAPVWTSQKVRFVALKLTRSSMIEVPPHHALREGRILKQTQHENIIPLLDSFKAVGGSFVLVFPWIAADLETIIRNDTIDHSLSTLVLRGLFSGLAFLHTYGIIHRDVKPSNVLIDIQTKSVYLADFGIAWHPEDRDSELSNAKITDVGTTSYRAPELLFGNNAYTTSLDLWAAGCVATEVIRHRHQPLFECGEGSSELGLIKSIFSTLGTPTNDIWPVSIVKHVACHRHVTFQSPWKIDRVHTGGID